MGNESRPSNNGKPMGIITEATESVSNSRDLRSTVAASERTLNSAILAAEISESFECAAPIYLRRFRSGVSRTGVSGECWSEPATPDAARNGTGNEARSFNVKSGRLREV